MFDMLALGHKDANVGHFKCLSIQHFVSDIVTPTDQIAIQFGTDSHDPQWMIHVLLAKKLLNNITAAMTFDEHIHASQT